VGAKGLTVDVVASVSDALAGSPSGMVKVKLGEGCGLERRAAAAALERLLRCVCVKQVGFVITLYREPAVLSQQRQRGGGEGDAEEARPTKSGSGGGGKARAAAAAATREREGAASAPPSAAKKRPPSPPPSPPPRPPAFEVVV
jgi:RNA-binding protein YhbY